MSDDLSLLVGSGGSDGTKYFQTTVTDSVFAEPKHRMILEEELLRLVPSGASINGLHWSGLEPMNDFGDIGRKCLVLYSEEQ